MTSMTYLQPLERNINLLISQRLHLALNIRQRRNEESLNDRQDLFPHPDHNHILGRITEVGIQCGQIGVEEIE